MFVYRCTLLHTYIVWTVLCAWLYYVVACNQVWRETDVQVVQWNVCNVHKNKGLSGCAVSLSLCIPKCLWIWCISLCVHACMRVQCGNWVMHVCVHLCMSVACVIAWVCMFIDMHLMTCSTCAWWMTLNQISVAQFATLWLVHSPNSICRTWFWCIGWQRSGWKTC